MNGRVNIRGYIPAHVVGDEGEQYASDKYPECNADSHDNQYPCRIAKQIDNITRPAVLFYLVETIETARCKVSRCALHRYNHLEFSV